MRSCLNLARQREQVILEENLAEKHRTLQNAKLVYHASGEIVDCQFVVLTDEGNKVIVWIALEITAHRVGRIDNRSKRLFREPPN